jgi:hypothetical protein
VNDRDGVPMVIAGCSSRKLPAASPVPALELYQGGCVPALREAVASWAQLRARTWIISAEHGLLHADAPLLPYDRRMDIARALSLLGPVNQTLHEDFARHGRPSAVLVIAEPVYQLALISLSVLTAQSRVTWIDDPAAGWEQAAALLDSWRKRS